MSKKINIYLCDPTHDTVVLVSDTIPLNIGFVAAYCLKNHGKNVNIELFKYPNDILKAIKSAPPAIIGFSNYSWNSNLSEHLASVAKKLNPETITVFGGTNFPDESEQQKAFLDNRPNVDAHIDLEGEIAFSNLVSRVLESNGDRSKIWSKAISGISFSTRHKSKSVNSVLVRGERPPRIKNLDDIPSPYLTGLFDKFFDGRLRPFLETNRGCPFRCSFCHTGNDYFQKTNMFSIERIKAEVAYIAPRMKKHGITGLHIADTNFGMYPRDRDICLSLKEASDTYGWPKQVIATTGKNNKERVIEITGIMGNTFNVNMSVQSMDQKVLANINRANIKIEDYVGINKHLQELGRPGFGELILGLPGESRESFLRGLMQVVEAGVSATTVYSLMLLHGTDFQKPAYRQKFRIEGRFRIVPLNFGEYDGEKVFDYEEVAIQTKDMSFDDYKYLRGISLIVETIHNGRPFEEFFRYLLAIGVSRSSLITRAYESINDAPSNIQDVMANFLRETETELWDDEKELIAHYKKEENYKLLRQGKAGGNLIQKYKALGLTAGNKDWIRYIRGLAQDEVCKIFPAENERDEKLAELDAIEEFCVKKLEGILDPDGNTDESVQLTRWDIAGWLQSDELLCLSEFRSRDPIEFKFYYTDAQIKEREEYFLRYGTSLSSLSKIVTRISSIESVIRKVANVRGEAVIYRGVDHNRSTRYTIAT